MIYKPDAQDELIGDAMAIGGPVFVEELHWAATAAAEAACPWDGSGPEPPAYQRAWLVEARRLVAARRDRLRATPESQVSSATSIPAGILALDPPSTAPAGRSTSEPHDSDDAG